MKNGNTAVPYSRLINALASKVAFYVVVSKSLFSG
jgi:hypothetical protein